jgi:hypothetical protein
MSDDIVNRLRDRAYSGKVPDSLSDEAAAEIERLRSLTRFQDGVIRSGDVACLTQAEREALEVASVWVNPERHATLRGLLERLGGHQ